jgi:phage shock protein PspC (stress-responsive transcriptional regulator)
MPKTPNEPSEFETHPTNEQKFESNPAPDSSESFTFSRYSRNPRKGKFLGVCYGLGQAFHIEPIWIRLVFIALFFPLPFVMVIVYVLAALIMKEESQVAPVIIPESPSQSSFEKVEKLIKKFFEVLYTFAEKAVNALR